MLSQGIEDGHHALGGGAPEVEGLWAATVQLGRNRTVAKRGACFSREVHNETGGPALRSPSLLKYGRIQAHHFKGQPGRQVQKSRPHMRVPQGRGDEDFEVEGVRVSVTVLIHKKRGDLEEVFQTEKRGQGSFVQNGFLFGRHFREKYIRPEHLMNILHL
jgi:hypothetical protein